LESWRLKTDVTQEKAGLFVGHTEAIVTGTLAGNNAVCHINKKEPLVLSSSLAVGDIITFVREQMKTEEGLNHKFTFSGPVYFDRMKRKGLYSVDVRAIEERVANAGVTGVFSERA
jgi:folate-dependent tRNA-U54 methylase TrmFO/GidA